MAVVVACWYGGKFIHNKDTDVLNNYFSCIL